MNTNGSLAEVAAEGWASAAKLTADLDVEVAALLPSGPVALVATGSWGRGELCPHSDLDVLVLWGGRRGRSQVAAESVLYPLWDSGRQIGHAVRTPGDCARAAENDLTIATTILDSRFVAGDGDLFAELQKKVRSGLAKRRSWFTSALDDADATRHRAYGHTGRLAHPHLKLGRGSLRDASSMRWRGSEPAVPGSDLHTAIGVLLAARTRLHNEAGRAEDVLTPEYPNAYALTSLVYAAARRIALAHRRSPPPACDLPAVLDRTDVEGIRDAFDANPPGITGWERVHCRPPGNSLHVLAVDSHLVETAINMRRELDGFEDEIASGIDRPDLIGLTGLLHDIGKGSEGDHSVEGAALAVKVAFALGIDDAGAEILALMARHHLRLAEIATRRDLDDEAALNPLVVALRSPSNLRLLYLLTRADSMATAPNMWGEWRAQLCREAFVKALHLLEHPAPQRLDWRRSELRQVLAREHPVHVLSEIDDHLDGLPPEYLNAFRTPEQIEHFAVMRPRPEAGCVRVRPFHDREGTAVLVAASDRTGLLADVSAALTVHGIDVLAARMFTRADGVALESYRVQHAFGEDLRRLDWSGIERDIGSDVGQRLDQRVADYGAARSSWRDRSAKPEVKVTNVESDFYTVVEVEAGDAMGLLARLAAAIRDERLDVHVAKIVTEGARARDTFYVRDDGGQKVDPARHEVIAAALVAAAASQPSQPE